MGLLFSGVATHKCGVRNGPPFIAYWVSDSVAQPDDADVEAFSRANDAVAWATYREALRNVPEQEGFPVQGDLAGSSR
ncbi:phage tail assembly chaperone [Burkholderia ambifaria]|uniref:phage tail assembly chaperone n=1 Tax=Burkholderia ambifaria TaxID=152480 RepID=UPI000F7FCFD9